MLDSLTPPHSRKHEKIITLDVQNVKLTIDYLFCTTGVIFFRLNSSIVSLESLQQQTLIIVSSIDSSLLQDMTRKSKIDIAQVFIEINQ